MHFGCSHFEALNYVCPVDSSPVMFQEDAIIHICFVKLACSRTCCLLLIHHLEKKYTCITAQASYKASWFLLSVINNINKICTALYNNQK